LPVRCWAGVLGHVALPLPHPPLFKDCVDGMHPRRLIDSSSGARPSGYAKEAAECWEQM